jgi:hypothetical protein
MAMYAHMTRKPETVPAGENIVTLQAVTIGVSTEMAYADGVTVDADAVFRLSPEQMLTVYEALVHAQNGSPLTEELSARVDLVLDALNRQVGRHALGRRVAGVQWRPWLGPVALLVLGAALLIGAALVR